MLQSFIIPFLAICTAELGDKSQLSILLLSAKVKNHTQLLLGVLLAFLFVDGLAIILGSWITHIIPSPILNIVSGVIFIFFGIQAIRSHKEEAEMKVHNKNAFLSGFTVIFFAEWGDKTQIASILFSAKYNPVLVFLAVMAAMTLLSITAVYIGKVFFKKIDRKVVSLVSGALFIFIGLSTILFNI